MKNIKKINDINFDGKVAIIRVDFNVPLDKKFNITDTTRIDLGIHSIKYVLDNGGKCIVMSHLGRPKGNGYQEEFSLKNIIKYLSDLLNKEICLVDNYFSDNFPIHDYLIKNDVILLENLRFYSEEKQNDLKFSKKLASMADIYINNAFGTCHREHASTNSIIKYSKNYCIGDLVYDELSNINRVLFDENKPFTAILGGAKVSDKINVIEKLIDLVDNIVIGGAMANTFIKSKGGNIGKSLYEEDITAFYERVDNILTPIVDFEVLIKSIIGKKNYQNTSEDLKNRFKIALKNQLIRIYAKTIVEYSNSKITIISSTKNKGFYIVKTELSIGQGKPPFQVIYVMKNSSNSWKIVEVVANGLRLVKSLRKSLLPEIEEKGIEAVINRLETDSPESES